MRNLATLSKWLSAKSLTKTASLNALAGVLDYGVRFAVTLVINPLLVVGLGAHGYGLWQVLRQLTGYILPVSGRATQVLKWTIASEQASTDYEEKRRYVGSAVGVWLLFVPFMAILGGLLAWNAPFWLNASAEFVSSVRVASALIVLTLILTTLTDVPLSVLEGENLGYKRMGLLPVLSLAGGGLTVLALYFNSGLIGLATANLARALLGGVVFLQVVRTSVRWFGVARPSFQYVRRFFGLSGWFIIWMAVVQFMMTGDVVLLGMFDSVEMVTTYALTKYAPDIVIVLVSIAVFGTLPGLGGLIGSGALRKAARVRNEIMALTWLVVTVAGTTILLWVKSFIQLWVGTQYYAGSIPTLLIVVMVTQFVFIRNDALIIDLTLDLRRKVLVGVLSTTVSSICAWILVGPLRAGITGLCLGLIGGRIILSISYPVMASRFLGVPLFAQLKGTLRPVLVTALLFLPASKFGTLEIANGWIKLVLSVGATFGGVLLLAFYLGFSSDQRTRLLDRVRQVIWPSA